jgi:hypothetical protein
MLRTMTKVVAEDKTERGRAEHDRDQYEPELEATQPKEHQRPPIVSATPSRASPRRGNMAS